MEDPGLGNRIATAVVSAFENVKTKAGKPAVRLNGVKEWTVLAGLVAIENGKVTVLTLATGVKAMPDDVRKYSSGWIVHDMHAEVLCLRMFNWFLMEEVKKGGETVLEKTGRDVPFRLRPSLKLAMYISEPPCGDASMGEISREKEAWADEPSAKRQKVTRGRAHFDRLGLVRTKPGRADSKITYSKSCSDKLCIKQATGVLNALTSLAVEPIFLDYLVLKKENFSQTDFDRCFTRLDLPNLKALKVLLYSEDTYRFHKNDVDTPLPLSLVHCEPLRMNQVLQIGVKNGGYVKNKPPKACGAALICNRLLMEQAKETIKPAWKSYDELKRSNAQREQLKRAARASLDSWPETAPDDFPIA